MDAKMLETCGIDADGEVVWSWRPRYLALSFAQDERKATVANGMVHQERV